MSEPIIGFVALRSGVLLCGECYVDGCTPVEFPEGYICDACGHEVPFKPLPPRVPWWRRLKEAIW